LLNKSPLLRVIYQLHF